MIITCCLGCILRCSSEHTVLYAKNDLFFDQIQFNDKLGFWNLLPLWTTLDLIIS
jgi:hypothetical protein